MRHVEFIVYGVAQPKGSTKAFYVAKLGRAIVTADNRKSKPWQESVVAAARDAIGGEPPLDEPVALAVRFFLPRPKTAPRRIVEPAKKPDLSKLIRLVEDGLTRAGVYRDDAQIVCLIAKKEFAGGRTDPLGEQGIPRVWIEIGSFNDMLLWWAWPGEDQRRFEPTKSARQTLPLFTGVESSS